MTTSAVLVTGASRGFGRCLTLDFVRELKTQNVDLHLWARSEEDLQETERLARVEWQKAAATGELRCFLQCVDLSDAADYTHKVDHVLLQLAAQSYGRVFLVHNAGSLGRLGLAQECASSPTELAQYWELNVTSVLWLNKRFLDVYGASREELRTSTSVDAHVYCTGKAAREMHHRVVATEQAAVDKVRVLQYSPGPMDTDMQKTIRESSRVDPELRKQFADMKAQGTLIPPAQSSQRGINLAVSGEYETGAHVDYYDLDPPSKH
ncbi:hypothetical protein PRNP1_004660 [Phytophthora ramorum]